MGSLSGISVRIALAGSNRIHAMVVAMTAKFGTGGRERD
jgi:hypothetical protein